VGSYEEENQLSDFIKLGKNLEQLSDWKFLKDSGPWSYLLSLLVLWVHF
jgi:hypothetical protein